MILIKLRERILRRCFWRSAIQHRDPEDPPAQNAQDSDQVHEPFGRAELCIFHSASGLQDLVKRLDLPTLSIPGQLLDCVLARLHGQISQQLPVDSLAPFGRALLLCVDRCQDKVWIVLLFADGRTNQDAAKAYLKNRSGGFASFVTDLDTVKATRRGLLHFIADRMFAITGQTVNTGPNKEMGNHFPGQAEQLINIALAISHVHAAIRIVQQRGGLADVVQPADAVLFLDRHARRVDAALQLIGAVKFATIPELDCGQTERQPSGSGYKAGTHKDAARGVILASIADGQLLQHSYRRNVLTREGEFGRVVENQNGKRTGGRELSRVEAKCPARIFASVTLSLLKNRYAAFAFASPDRPRAWLPQPSRQAVPATAAFACRDAHPGIRSPSLHC